MVRPVLTGQNQAAPPPWRFTLASASPRRAGIIRRLGLAVAIVPSRVDEERLPRPAGAEERARGLAAAKAAEVFRRHAGRLVLGADTLVALDGAALGKPGTPAAAIAMLGRLSGRQHAVHTGLALLAAEPAATAVTETGRRVDDAPHLTGLRRARIDGGWMLTAVVTSLVTFHPLSDEQIAAYVATGEPLDKAGAYGIQGLGHRLVAGLDGCFTNVVGLPLCTVAEMLSRTMGCPVRCPTDPSCRVAGIGCRCEVP